MRLSSFLFLFFLSSRGRRTRNLAVVGGLATGMLTLGLAVVAGFGMGRSLQRRLDTLFPAHRVVLRPRALDALWLRFETSAITPATLERVRALPGVQRVSPEASLRFPVSGEGELMGYVYRSDVTVTGVEKWLLEDAAPPDFAYHPGRDLPAILSEYFLDLYNMALAESNRLPKFSPAAIIGRRFGMILGESSLRPADPSGKTTATVSAKGVRAIPCRIAGLTNNPDLLGLLIPLDAVETFNAWYGFKDKRYRALHVELASAEGVENLARHAAALGLEMTDRQTVWRRVLRVVQLAAGAFAALGVLVFALALAYMGSSVAAMLAQRRRELALFGALGASPLQILALVMAEIAATSALGIALGLGGALLAIRSAGHWYQTWRAYRTYLPENLFALPSWWILAFGVGCWALATALAFARVAADLRKPLSVPLSRP